MSSESKIDDFVGQVDSALDELSILANSNPSVDVFLDNLLARANLILGSKASVVWHTGPDNTLLKSRSRGTKIGDAIPAPLREEICRCIDSQESRTYSQGAGTKQIDVILWPLKTFIPAAAIALYFNGGISANTEPVVLRVVAALAELADDYFASCVIAQRDELEKRYDKLVKFSNEINGDLSLRNTAITIANQSRNIFDCDRVSVLKRSGSVFVLIASSGVQAINRRANSCRKLESMVRKVFRKFSKTVVYIPSNVENNVIEKKLDEYCETNQLETMLLVPIREKKRTGKTGFALAIEYKNLVKDVGSIVHRINSVEPQIKSALNNSQQYESLPFLGSMRGLQSMLGMFGTPKRLFYMAIGLGLVCLAAIALFFLKTDLNVHVRGQLMAPAESYVFAPDDGLVDQVLVSHGQQISKGDLVVVLRSDQLDLEIAEAQGKLDIATKKLASEEVALSAFSRDGTPEAQEALIALTSETIETKEQISYFENELELLKIRKSKLEVVSPMDGEVVSWDPERALGGSRPVTRGDRLVQIVKTGKKWLAEVNVPGDQITHLLNDEFEIDEEMKLSLSIASAPDQVLEGKVTEVARVVDQGSETGYSAVRVMVEFEAEGDVFENLRPGTTVAANISCGKVSIGYSLFHRVLFAIRFRFF